MIKLLIGGSPCTFWSIANKHGREVKAEGLGWELFKNYLIAKEKFKPDFFLYENNKSAAKAIKEQIKKELNVWDGTLYEPDTGARYIEINSALVSAQNRQRFYVHNCGEVEQPRDRGILLRDILENANNIPVNITSEEKSQTIKAQYSKNSAANFCCYSSTYGATGAAEPVRIPDYSYTDKARPINSYYQNNCGGIERRIWSDNPSKQQVDVIAAPVLCAIQSESLRIREATKKGYAEIEPDNCFDYTQPNSKTRRGRNMANKSNCVMTSCQHYQYCGVMGYAHPCEWDENGEPIKAISCADGKAYPVYLVKDSYIHMKGKQYPIKLIDGYWIIRKLTVVECCRLQTMPDDYCRAVSDSAAYRGLGNGWTAEVIIHILNGALKDVPRDEEIVVLSMYDGIGTGRYCLDKMGFTNIKYFAYEIDKFAKQISNSNYPDIIQMGDAFGVRYPDWTIGY